MASIRQATMDLGQWESGALDVLDFLNSAQDPSFDELAGLFTGPPDEEMSAIIAEADSDGGVVVKEEQLSLPGVAQSPSTSSPSTIPNMGFKSGSNNSATTASFDMPALSGEEAAFAFGDASLLGADFIPSTTGSASQFAQQQLPFGQTAEQLQMAEQQQTAGAAKGKRRRVRNAEQMELNRQAQQRYRARKRQEQNELQATVDMLASQMAALKALEKRYVDLEVSHNTTQQQLMATSQQVVQLESVVADQAAKLTKAEEQLAKQQKLIVKQQEVILTQQQKLQLQQDIMDQLKDQIRDSIETASTSLNNQNPNSVCQVMIGAVKDAILSAEDVNGIHAAVINMPDELIHEISKNVLCACKRLWPELKLQLNCSQQQMKAEACPVIS